MGDNVRQLADDTVDLVRRELALAKLEMQQMLRELAADAVQVGVAAAVAGVGGLALTAFLILVIGDLLDAYWAGALIVGVVFVLVGGVLAYRGIQDMKRRHLKPEQTLETLKEDKEFAQREADDFRRDIAA